MGKDDEAIIKILTDKIQKQHGLDREDAHLRAVQEYLSTCKAVAIDPDTSSDEDESCQNTRLTLAYADRDTRRDLEARKADDKAMYISVRKFSGDPDELRRTTFDKFCKEFERAIRRENWTEEEVLSKFRLKLTDLAADAFDDFETTHPSSAKNYKKMKELLHQRFHGGETEEKLQNEFGDSKMKSRESVQDYAARLRKLHNRAYPPGEDVSKTEQKLRAQMLQRQFTKGLDPELREKFRLAVAINPDAFSGLDLQKHIQTATRLQLELNESEKRSLIKVVKEEQAEGLSLMQRKMDSRFDQIVESIAAVSQPPQVSTPLTNPTAMSTNVPQQATPNPEQMTAQIAAAAAAAVAAAVERAVGQAAPQAQPRQVGTNPKACWNCNREGHLRSNCPEPPRQGGGQGRPPQGGRGPQKLDPQQRSPCGFCSQIHFGICPYRPLVPSRACRGCGGMHWIDQCPSFQPKPPGNQGFPIQHGQPQQPQNPQQMQQPQYQQMQPPQPRQPSAPYNLQQQPMPGHHGQQQGNN